MKRGRLTESLELAAAARAKAAAIWFAAGVGAFGAATFFVVVFFTFLGLAAGPANALDPLGGRPQPGR